MDVKTVAKQFTDYYYTTFDANRSSLAPLYRAGSMLTFEGTEFLGATAIVEKLGSLSFNKVQHKVTTIDVQPSVAQGAIIVSVTGLLVVDDSPNPLNFSQIFQLVSEANTYYVHNDVFRLNYG